ncbi:MAG: NAD(+)/NADH kinase [Leptospiraceae bacterium]|nr:NAD(+)/NADH kinase [Leptospiraceae bacterium]
MKKAILVTKKSALESYAQSSFLADLLKHPRLKREIEDADAQHRQSIETLTSLLHELNFEVHRMARNEPFPEETEGNAYELVIAAGGDGTFIQSSHFLKKMPILGVNTAPDFSIGHYCMLDMIYNKENARNILNSILDDELRPVEIPRLQLRLNDQILPIPVINDLLVTDTNPAATCRYLLQINQQEELQKSSGIWISTSNGSTAAFASAGGVPFPERNKEGRLQFGFIVREPYTKIDMQYKKGLIQHGQNFKVTSVMPDGRIFCDGNYRTCKFSPGDTLEIDFADSPLFAFRDESKKIS